MCLILAGAMVVFEFRQFGFQFIAYYFLFFVMGYYIHKYQDAIITGKGWLIGFLAVVWAIMAWFWNMHELPAFLKTVPLPQTLMQYGYRFLTATIAIYVMFCICPIVLNKKSKIQKPILWFGKNSLGVYTTHLLFIPMIARLFMGLGCGVTLIVVLSFILAAIISWILVWLIGCNRVSARLLLGKL